MAVEAFTPTGPVTGDAVELEIRPANLASRMAAQVIDLLIAVALLLGLLIWMIQTFSSRAMSESLQTVVVLGTLVGVLVALPATIETLTQGKSVGKYALGLRVVRDDHGTVRGRHAITRALIGFVEIWMTAGVAALLTAAFTRSGKRLGDLAAGTIVVSERVPLRWPSPMPMPQHLARWAANADIAALDPRTTLAARQYLLRRGQLSSMAREKVSRQLADHLRSRVSPQPPVSTADDLIMAIIAERGRRDRHRLARDEELRARLFGGSSRS